jgi:glycosyltransferase involved in cell wall biosynthesis
MLEPWSLAFKAGKKRLALAAYQRREIGQAALLHATAAEELEGIRLFGARQPCAVIPIGVHLPVFMEKPDCEVKTALFLSRIHPKKGILELLRAWKRLAPKDWRLVLAGNDDGGHLAAVESEIRILGLGDQVSNEGAAFGEKKERLFREADVFLLPSYSENFGIVVTEALSYGVPVLTTTGTPWKHLPKERCGWCIGTGQEPLIRGLEEVLTTSLKQLREMGAAGRALVERDYRWERVAEQFAITYQWLLDGGQTPSWVYS